jgi:hypothetical protein
MDPRVLNAKLLPPDSPLSEEEKWHLCAPYWLRCRRTGYGQVVRRALRGLFQIDDLNEQTFRQIGEQLRASQKRDDWYDWVLRDQAGIEAVVISGSERRRKPEDLFFLARHVSILADIRCVGDIRTLESAFNIAITGLDDMLRLMDAAFERWLEPFTVCVKIALAYRRTLAFELTPKADAERVLLKILGDKAGAATTGGDQVGWAEAKPLQDYLMHQIVRRAVERRLPLQIHTGIFAGGCGGNLCNSNPHHLTNLFQLYPQGRFDIFHIGWPYHDEAVGLAKMFPNVWLDFCWAHAISPEGAKRVLSECLEVLPINKIFAFGGDYHLVECSYGHLELVRDALAEILTEKVTRGLFDEEEALRTARRLLHENASEFFNIPEARAATEKYDVERKNRQSTLG